MKLPAAIFLSALCTLPLVSIAGPMGYPTAKSTSAKSCPQDCRYRNKVVETTPYRQCEDSRRYNAAPCTPPIAVRPSEFHRPVLIDSAVIDKSTELRTFYDSKGNKYTSEATILTVREIYSDGYCRIRKKTIAGSYEL